jgi:hypothetical protein
MCDPGSSAKTGGLQPESQLDSLGYDFCLPPQLVLVLDLVHLQTNAGDYCPNVSLAKQSGSDIHAVRDIAEASRDDTEQEGLDRIS